MWELNCEERWMPKNWCFWTLVLEKTLESPLDSKEIQPVHPKGNESCIFIGRTDVETETPVLWPPDATSWLIWKDPDTGKDWRWEEKGIAEKEMVGWHHWLNGHEFEKTPRDSEREGSLVCYNPWGNKESGLCIWWPKYWSFSFNISPSNEYSRLISFKIDWFDLLAVQGTLKSVLSHLILTTA